MTMGLKAVAVTAADTQWAIEVRNLCKRFTIERSLTARLMGCLSRSAKETPEIKYAVKDVSFAVPKGKIFGLLGRNGCGKSTVIRVLSTLLTADSGEVRVLGYDVTENPLEIQKRVGRVSVDPSFWKVLTVDQNLRHYVMLYSLGVRESMSRAAKLMARFGLKEGSRAKAIKTLSRGEQQKVAITRALLPYPEVLFLDEPTTGLDPASKRTVQRCLRELNDEGITILLTTHDMHEAEGLCDEIAIMSEGALIAQGTSSQLREQSGVTGSMEDVFIKLTGKHLDESQDEELEVSKLSVELPEERKVV